MSEPDNETMMQSNESNRDKVPDRHRRTASETNDSDGPDHVDEVVVEEDLDEDEADDQARERSARYVVVTGASLQECAAETTISWDCGDVRKVTDGGAIDNDFEDAEQSPRGQLEAGRLDIGAASYGGLFADDVAIDLVTRQPLRVRGRVADDLVEYYEDTGFDLYNYKQHPFLPVTLDDTVYECVFIGDIEGLHNFSKTYDYPAGRLARVPTELAGGDA